MLVQDFIQSPLSFDEVRTAILRDPHGLIDRNAADAYREGEQCRLTVSSSTIAHGVHKTVYIDIGEPYARGDGLVVPLRWWAKGATLLFPRLDADLEIMPVGPRTTQVSLSGRYDPPLGAVGRQIDRMLMHRLAEASIRDFLTRMGSSLEEVTSPARQTQQVG